MAHLAILDVGHGVCGVLYSDNLTLMVDCPPGDTVFEFLRRELGRRRIDHILISHADRDHCGGLPAILNQDNGFEVGRIWMNDEQDRTSAVYRQILNSFRKRRLSGSPVKRSVLNDQSPNGEIWIDEIGVKALLPYHEDRAASGSANQLSAVVRLAAEGQEALALFMADIGARSLESIAPDDLEDYRTEWLVFPHHGGRSGGDDQQFARDVVGITEAQRVVFSFSRARGERPSPAIVAEVRRSANIVCTQLSKLCSDADVRGAQLFDGEIPVGSSLAGRGLRCGGSIKIEVASGKWRGEGEHAELVSQLDDRLCRRT